MIEQFLEGTSCPKELTVQGKQLPVNTTAGEAEGSSEIIISEINWWVIAHQLIIQNIGCYPAQLLWHNSSCMLCIVLKVLQIQTIVGCGNFQLLPLLSKMLSIKQKEKKKTQRDLKCSLKTQQWQEELLVVGAQTSLSLKDCNYRLALSSEQSTLLPSNCKRWSDVFYTLLKLLKAPPRQITPAVVDYC